MRRIFISTLAGMVAIALLPGCFGCDDIGCAGGLEWTAAAEDGTAVPPGDYVVSITLEDDTYQTNCVVADQSADSECEELEHVDGNRDYDLEFWLEQLGDEWDPEQPVGGFRIMAVDSSGGEPDDSYSEHRGPTFVAIEITGGAGTLIDDSFDIEYQRDDAYRGDDRCGFCDSLEQRSSSF